MSRAGLVLRDATLIYVATLPSTWRYRTGDLSTSATELRGATTRNVAWPLFADGSPYKSKYWGTGRTDNDNIREVRESKKCSLTVIRDARAIALQKSSEGEK